MSRSTPHDPRFRPLHREEYDRMVEMGVFANERVELLDGALVEIAPPGPAHTELVSRLSARLVRSLGDRAEVRVHSPLAASDFSEPEPDLAIVEPGGEGGTTPTAALLIIEVSDRSLEDDLALKPRVYASAGVAEYWVVDLEHQRVEVFAGPEVDRFTSRRTVVPGERIAPIRFSDIELPVAELFP